jgi:hypothetical protein
MVFTGYTDTMDGLRDWLADQTGREVICFSGRGGEIRLPDGGWKLVSRAEIKSASVMAAAISCFALMQRQRG